MPDHRSAARAAILAGTLEWAALPEPFVERRLRVPAIRVVMPRNEPPLDLDAPLFRYIVSGDGTVRVNRDPVGARTCVSAPECRSSRSSSADEHRRPRRR